MDSRMLHQQVLKNSCLSHGCLQVLRWSVMVISVFLLLTGIPACNNSSLEPETNPTQVILKLGGDDCEFYLGAVDAALKKLKGVQEIDLSTQKGHAIVKTDGTLKASQIFDVVDGLSGEGWECEAELKK